MKIKRKAMFETNSSTIHSLILDLGDCKKTKLSRNGRVIVRMGHYDSNTDILVTPREKLNWLFTMLFVQYMGNCYDKADFEEDINIFEQERKYDIEDIKEVIEEVEGEPVSLEFRMNIGEDGVSLNHQLHGNWYSLDDYLGDIGISLKDFIYNDKVRVKFEQD